MFGCLRESSACDICRNSATARARLDNIKVRWDEAERRWKSHQKAVSLLVYLFSWSSLLSFWSVILGANHQTISKTKQHVSEMKMNCSLLLFAEIIRKRGQSVQRRGRDKRVNLRLLKRVLRRNGPMNASLCSRRPAQTGTQMSMIKNKNNTNYGLDWKTCKICSVTCF